MKSFSYGDAALANTPTLILEPLNDTFVTKRIELFETLKIGRKVNTKTNPEPTNGVFDSKVLSRNHAEVWCEDGKVWIKDVKSSNGTFVNDQRLSEESTESAPKELKTGDKLEFGIDINNDDGKVVFKKVSCRVSVIHPAGASAPPPQGEPAKMDMVNGKKPSTKKAADINAILDNQLAAADETHAELQHLQATLAEIKRMHAASEAAAKQREKDASDALAAAVTSATAQLARQLEESRGELDQWKKKHDELVPQLEANQDTQKREEDLKNELAKRAQKREEELKSELVKREKQFKDETERLSKEVQEGSRWRVEAETWKSRAAEIEQQKDGLTKEFSEAKTKQSALEAIQKELELKSGQLERDIKTARQENAAAQAEIARLSSESGGLKKELSLALERADSLRQSLNGANKEMDAARKEAAALRSEMEKLKKEVDSANAARRAAEAREAELKKALAAETARAAAAAATAATAASNGAALNSVETTPVVVGGQDAKSPSGSRKRSKKAAALQQAKAEQEAAAVAAALAAREEAERIAAEAAAAKSSFPFPVFAIMAIGILSAAAGGFALWTYGHFG
ncbi:hypothetical protein HK104_010265 [Borealophlyctis nickersoniae]|nr:hypothetical protein HK104_010265 [Borealophlyctis nickersoniae]